MTSIRRAGVLAAAFLWAGAAHALADAVLEASFNSGTDGFAYIDDSFRGTSQPLYAAGEHDAVGGYAGGCVAVKLGAVDNVSVDDMSGAWERTFDVTADQELELSFRYRLTQSGDYDATAISHLIVTLDGTALGSLGNDFVAEIEGDGAGGIARSTGWRAFRTGLGILPSGTHTLRIGGFNNHKTALSEVTDVRFDDVRVGLPNSPAPSASEHALVSRLDPIRFRLNVATLASYQTRFWNQSGNSLAGDWIEAQLASYGYAIERHDYLHGGIPKSSIYVTKVGSVRPDQMWIVSAHMDSTNTQSPDQSFAPGADDDASGVALVLEAARVFAPAEVHVESSVRFILWNNEETSLYGSAAYVADRKPLQAVNETPASGPFPEPVWLGILQHDMILFDHGLPPQPNQITAADIDIEYQAAARFSGLAEQLALAALAGNGAHATEYPAEVGSNMDFTDSRSFWHDCPAISLRENRRIEEIGHGANPNWHKTTDVMATYSDADFRLGLNTVQTTVGTIAGLVEAEIRLCGDGIVASSEACDDAGTTPGDGCEANCTHEAGWICAGEPTECALCRAIALGFADSLQRDVISWTRAGPSLCASRYDIARGDLEALLTLGSFFDATCLDADRIGTDYADATVPDAGRGFWYLVRPHEETWNSRLVLFGPDRDTTLTVCPQVSHQPLVWSAVAQVQTFGSPDSGVVSQSSVVNERSSAGRSCVRNSRVAAGN